MKKYKPLLSLFLAVCVSCMSFLCVPIVAKAADDGEISNEYLYDKTYLEDGTVILYEDEEFYGEFERRFVCEDGLYVVATYPEPINYQTDKGEWRRIDNSLKRVGDRFENVDSSLYVSFAENSRDENLVHLSNNDIDFSWCLKFPTEDNGFIKNFINKIFSHNNQIENVEAVYCENVDTEANIMATNKNESRITYENVFSDSVDIQYTVLPGKVKENIVLDQKVGFESYTMSIICEGLSAVITEENCVEFLDANKEPQYIIQAPYMYDDIYEISYDIEMNLVATDKGYDITIFPDQDWLNSEERVYPIVIDPTVRTNTTKSNFSDTYIFQGSGASSSRAFEERLRVGIYNGKKYKALWKATNLPSIPQYAAIVSATFNLKLPDVTTTSRNFSIYKINSSWESDTVTWAQSGEMTYTLLQSNVKRNSENDTVTFSGTNLTNAVKSWYSGTANNGFIFRYTDESFDDPDYNVFYSSDNTTSTSYMPYLTVTYSYGAAKAYRSVTDPNTNCLGYALELYLSPGLAMYNNESVTTVFNRMESLVESKYDKNIRKLGTTDRLNTNEYLVAMRVGTHTVGNDIVVDYHFMVQLNNGYWAHKAGFLPSANLGNINPTTYTWNLFNTAGNVIYSNFYSSETIYFAVS